MRTPIQRTSSACLRWLGPGLADDPKAAPDPASEDAVAPDIVQADDVGSDPGDTAASEPRGTPFLACSVLTLRESSSSPAWRTWLLVGLVALLGRRGSPSVNCLERRGRPS